MSLRITLFLSTLVTIAIVHSVSIHFFLYWKYLWLDMPVHLLGGVACALGFSTLPFLGLKIFPQYSKLMWYVLFAFCVGLLWEVFEYTAGISRGEPGFVFDTLIDFGMDILGACIGYGIVKSTNVIIS